MLQNSLYTNNTFGLYVMPASHHRAGVRLTKFSKKMGWSAAREAKQIASVATDWGGNQLTRWGLVGDQRSGEMDGESPNNRILLWRWPGVGDDAASFLKRPLGISFDVEGIFGGERHSLYSAPPAGGTRKPGYRGEPVIPVSVKTSQIGEVAEHKGKDDGLWLLAMMGFN